MILFIFHRMPMTFWYTARLSPFIINAAICNFIFICTCSSMFRPRYRELISSTFITGWDLLEARVPRSVISLLSRVCVREFISFIHFRYFAKVWRPTQTKGSKSAYVVSQTSKMWRQSKIISIATFILLWLRIGTSLIWETTFSL